MPFEVRCKVGDWYEADFLPEMRRVLGWAAYRKLTGPKKSRFPIGTPR